MDHKRALSYVTLCVLCIGLGAATYRLFVVPGHAGYTDNRVLTLHKPGYRIGPGGTIGLGTPAPDDPIVFTNPVPPYNELYRLRTDGSEWYAPGADLVQIKGRAFQARCQTLCL